MPSFEPPERQRWLLALLLLAVLSLTGWLAMRVGDRQRPVERFDSTPPQRRGQELAPRSDRSVQAPVLESTTPRLRLDDLVPVERVLEDAAVVAIEWQLPRSGPDDARALRLVDRLVARFAILPAAARGALVLQVDHEGLQALEKDLLEYVVRPRLPGASETSEAVGDSYPTGSISASVRFIDTERR